MNEQDFDKRFHKLKNAYDKLQERTNPADVMHQLKPKVEPIEVKRKRRAWHIPLLSAASIVLLFGLGTSLLPDDGGNASQDVPIEEPVDPDFDYKMFTSMLKNQYERLEIEQFQKSGLTREQYFSMPSVSLAKQLYARYMTGNWEEANGRSEKEFVDYLMYRLQEELYTPSELVQQKANQFDRLPLDLQMSQSVLQQYSWRYQEYARAKSEDGLIYKRSNDADRDLLDEVLDPMFAPILDFYEAGPIMYAGDMIVPLERLPELFIPMEAAYATDEIAMYEEKHELATLLFLSAKGTMSKNLDEQQAAVFENGVVNEEFREVWKRYAEQPEYTLSALIFRPIVEQMEQTNWTKSDAWDHFDYEDAMAHLDNLDNGFYGIPDKESSPVVVDSVFMQTIHGYFKLLAMEDSPDKYASLSPEEIVALYYYYGQLNEIELRYEMYIKDDRFLQIPWEEYKDGPLGTDLPFDQFAEKLSFIDHGLDEFDMNTGIVQIQLTEAARNDAEQGILSFQLIKTEEGWKIPFMPTQ